MKRYKIIWGYKVGKSLKFLKFNVSSITIVLHNIRRGLKYGTMSRIVILVKGKKRAK